MIAVLLRKQRFKKSHLEIELKKKVRIKNIGLFFNYGWRKVSTGKTSRERANSMVLVEKWKISNEEKCTDGNLVLTYTGKLNKNCFENHSDMIVIPPCIAERQRTEMEKLYSKTTNINV